MVCFCPWCTALKTSMRFSWSNICMHILQCLRQVPRTTGHQPALTMNLFRLMPAAFCQQPGSNTNRDSHKMPSTSSSVSILAVSRASLVCICHITWSRTLPFHHRFHPTLSKEAWIERNTVPGIQWSLNRGDFPPKWIMFKSKTQRRLKNIVESTPSKQPTFFGDLNVYDIHLPPPKIKVLMFTPKIFEFTIFGGKHDVIQCSKGHCLGGQWLKCSQVPVWSMQVLVGSECR